MVGDARYYKGDAARWPADVLRLFESGHLNHFERFLIVVFAYVNGLPCHMLVSWCNMNNMCHDQSAKDHIIDLYGRLESGSYNDRPYYGYNVTMDRYEYIDGTVRHYKSPK